jgi:hypothetical protein
MASIVTRPRASGSDPDLMLLDIDSQKILASTDTFHQLTPKYQIKTPWTFRSNGAYCLGKPVVWHDPVAVENPRRGCQ